MVVHSFGPMRPDPLRDVTKSFMPRRPGIWEYEKFGRTLDFFKTNADIILQEIEESGEFNIEKIERKYGQLINPLVYMISALYTFIELNAHTETMSYEYMGGLTPLPKEVIDYLRDQVMDWVNESPSGHMDPLKDLHIPIWEMPNHKPDLRLRASYVLDNLLRVQQAGE